MLHSAAGGRSTSGGGRRRVPPWRRPIGIRPAVPSSRAPAASSGERTRRPNCDAPYGCVPHSAADFFSGFFCFVARSSNRCGGGFSALQFGSFHAFPNSRRPQYEVCAVRFLLVTITILSVAVPSSTTIGWKEPSARCECSKTSPHVKTRVRRNHQDVTGVFFHRIFVSAVIPANAFGFSMKS